METPELWRVVWDDAHGGEIEVSAEDAEGFKPWRLTTVGWLVRKTRKGYTIALEYGPTPDQFRSYEFIPSKFVVSATRLDYQEVHQTKGKSKA